MSAAKLIARLKQLYGEACSNYYERVSIANTLMQDKAWLDEGFKGNDYKAAEALQSAYFGDLSGSMTIWMLLTIYRKFPNESDWKALKYDLRKLYEKCKPSASDQRVRQSERTVTRAAMEKIEQEKKDIKFQLQQTAKTVAERETELSALRKKCERLEKENGRLLGRVEELERILEGKLSA